MSENDLFLEALAERLGLKTEVRKIDDMDAYLEERARKAGLIAECVNPYCTKGEDGKAAIVDQRKRRSGACCKEHMNYECTHPGCVAKAKKNGWKCYKHAWGTKIAMEHQAYRVAPGDTDEAQS